ncbi:MAG: tRNA 4-thiouridine(8) synthase ThiI [Nanoarchaeota archaeon]|nr:tRNA 4-thiouridine(8) synthase ThiI [Nanoarchaeota archaeon]|tara:strand:+ start:1327 stop:2451 length:1125 start_codon:yes stop_codon:yes gene_type:complete
MKIIVHYGEIGLKGKNRGFFENRLIENIKNNLDVDEIKMDSKRVVVSSKSKDWKNLKNIFGIEYFSLVEESELDVDKIIKKSLGMIKKLKIKNLALSTTRSDKSFPLTSLELNKRIGEGVNKLGIKINFSDPDETLFIEITSKNCYLYTKKIKGLGGLPVGSSGKVLCLFSGGIDSALAAYLMMKRGCKVDFLHFHALQNNKYVEETKIKTILDKLNVFQSSCRMFVIPYHNYQLSSMEKVPESLDVVMFKNFMLRFGEVIARKNGYKALITGDSLGQVASQTLDNINSSRFKVNLPILSPLLSFDKQEIVDLAKKIGTYEESIKKYKDCCSIISRKPSTSVKIVEVEKVLEKLNFDKLIEESLDEMESVKLSF